MWSDVPPAGIAGIRARAADRSELAREISAALQAHDLAHAQALIHEGAAVFGPAAMVAAVEAQARQERTEAMGAVQGPASQYRASWGHHGAALVHGR